ncbi:MULTISPECIES: pilus assembly protein PilP [Undibacterium]|jgi:type IV pilus assembly protein PilP|uniref:Pilus assembly protein PilP n=1 Tax=Undibacterium umbellatum TaxID=2762300 RepID=A0ABR6Z742_9BURK|nr:MULTISPECIES: pilus assembly protein PilP [Undibacterium]MBC3907593.1 pilus assembly protein PilP [Undibacterium umbellatum]MDP1977741.1 pilus assembly protein PilP [Undibacterium sp.]
MMKFLIRPTIYMMLALSLSACGDAEETELKAWMDAEQKQAKAVIPKISPPKVYTPFSYAGKGEIEPFDPAKLLVVLARLKAASSNGIKAPNLDRPREALEAFPMDTLVMVGTIEKNKMVYGLVQVDKTVYQVKLGAYMGQNLGLITKISENEIEIKETVQDAAGDWIERQAKLELQEAKK